MYYSCNTQYRNCNYIINYTCLASVIFSYYKNNYGIEHVFRVSEWVSEWIPWQVIPVEQRRMCSSFPQRTKVRMLLVIPYIEQWFFVHRVVPFASIQNATRVFCLASYSTSTASNPLQVQSIYSYSKVCLYVCRYGTYKQWLPSMLSWSMLR